MRSKGLVFDIKERDREGVGEGGSGKFRDKPDCFRVIFIEIGEGGRGLS